MRLWAGTWATNLAGGWIITFVVIRGLPALRPEAIKVGSHFVALGVNGTSLASGVLAGAIITLMTWMQQGTDSMPAKIVAAIAAAFLLGSAGLNHAIVLSLDRFAALHSGAPFDYLDWIRLMLWAALGNMLGGIGLISMLRLAQVKAHQRENEPA